MKSLCHLLVFTVLLLITSCSNFSIGGGVVGGSGGDVDVGVGIGVELLTDD